MQHFLASVLLPEYRRKVLGLLFLRPDESFHGREIARRTGLPAGTLSRELSRLADVGLLERESRGDQVVYRANQAFPVFEEVAGILRKTSGLADVVASALAPLSDEIGVAFIFGSRAKGSQQEGSDIDVLIIGRVKFEAVLDAVHPAQKQLGREINPKVFSPSEWRQKIKSENGFAMDVLGAEVFLVGDANGLAELDRKKPGASEPVRRDSAALADRGVKAYRRRER